MSTATPLVFRPSLAQRSLAALLCAGSWLVGIRAEALLVSSVQGLTTSLHQALALGAPTWRLWAGLAIALLFCLLGGLALLLSALGLILIEGTQVLADDLGITVEHAGLPRPLARALGAGYLPWKHVRRFEKGRVFFILRGGPVPGEAPSPAAEAAAGTRLRFILVDELERLVNLVLERSSNMSFHE